MVSDQLISKMVMLETAIVANTVVDGSNSRDVQKLVQKIQCSGFLTTLRSGAAISLTQRTTARLAELSPAMMMSSIDPLVPS